jgi:pimeloyl-ACP methyl ester carboxylesterase
MYVYAMSPESITSTIDLSGGRVRIHEQGSGAPVVFVHGLLVNSRLWRTVMPQVATAGFRCLAPDLPLGAHSIAMPDADLSPPGVADLIAELLEKLDLTEVTVVANDTGGAITQILLTRHAERIGRVVLTNCDSFERFFPPMFAYLPSLAHVPGSMWLLTRLLAVRALQRLPLTFGWLSKRPVDPTAMKAYGAPAYGSSAIRADLARFLRGVHKRHTLAAAEQLREFARPVLLAWAPEDRNFPISLAHRLAERLPDATITEIADSLTFVPEDQPHQLARLIIDFVSVG